MGTVKARAHSRRVSDGVESVETHDQRVAFQAAFEYSEWLDGQGVILANDSRTHEELVKEWQATRG